MAQGQGIIHLIFLRAPDQGPNTGIGWVANTDGLLFARDINKDHK